ncbi:MAG: SDR family oxidoreductase [Ignavibacteriaceae bacterium]
MKILVTGGAGFIGSHITDEYIRNGHEVVIVDNLYSGFLKNINPDAKFVEMDITDNSLVQLFESEYFDVVNHHAAQMDVRKSVTDPVFDASTNILGSLNLLQCCIRTNVKQFIFASTGGAVYGEQEYFPADENHPLQPVSPYGISKLSVEKYLYFYHLQYKLNYSVLRYANIYGPRQNPHGEAGVVAIFVKKLLQDQQPVINGSGEQTRDYVFIDDVVKANMIVTGSTDSQVLNVGTGIETTVNRLYDLLTKLSGKNIEKKYRPAAPGEQMRSLISSEKFFRKYNWKPSVKLEEGLKHTLDYFQTEFTKL